MKLCEARRLPAKYAGSSLAYTVRSTGLTDTIPVVPIVPIDKRNIITMHSSLTKQKFFAAIVASAAGLSVLGAAPVTADVLPNPTPVIISMTAIQDDIQLLPKAEDLFVRHIDAIGGVKKIKAHKFSTATGSFNMPAMGISGDMVIKQAAPNKFYLSINIPGMGDMTQGFDGTVGWGINPMMGEMVLEGKELEQLKSQSDFYADLNYEKIFKTMKTTGKEDFNDQSCFVVELVTQFDSKSTRYFNVETGLIAGMEQTEESQMGPVTSLIMLDDYKEFDGVLYATTTTIQTMGQEQVLSVETISHDKLDDAVFALPDSIQALVAEDEDDEKDEEDGEK